jgi:Flp pilus assembly protein TadB
VQIITVLTLIVVFGLRFLNPDYVQPYDSFAGQVTLAVVCGVFALGFLWLRRLSKYDTARRFLDSKSAQPTLGRAGVPS